MSYTVNLLSFIGKMCDKLSVRGDGPLSTDKVKEEAQLRSYTALNIEEFWRVRAGEAEEGSQLPDLNR